MTKPDALRDDAVHVWTDGSCSPNPGKGGWAAIIQQPDGSEQELSGADPETTNNRMELTAAIRALEAVPDGSRVIVHTDSEYVSKGVTEWLPKWESTGWRSSSGKAVLNADLWAKLGALASRRCIEWRWVRGHADTEMNIRADRLSNAARQILL